LSSLCLTELTFQVAMRIGPSNQNGVKEGPAGSE
jgi:hypothetical protein